MISSMTTTTLRDLTSRYAPDELRIPEFDLADRLRKSMDLANMSVSGMGEAFGVTRDTVSRWINGRTKPSAAVLHLWAIGCGVDQQWLETGVPSAEAIALVEARKTAQAANPEVDGLAAVHPLGLEPRTRCLTVPPREVVNQPLTANRRGPILRVVAA